MIDPPILHLFELKFTSVIGGGLPCASAPEQ